MSRQFAVIGLGRFGSSLACALYKMGHEVLAVDNDKEKIQHMADLVTQAVTANALDEDVLKELGLTNFDVVVVAIGHDVQANIMVTVMLKELGVKYIVSKALNDLHGKVLEKVGADHVVFPERDMAIRLAHNFVSSNVLDLIELSEDFSIGEIIVPTRVTSKNLAEADLRAKYGITVIAIKSGEEINLNPGPETVLKKGDILVVTGTNDDIEDFTNLT